MFHHTKKWARFKGNQHSFLDLAITKDPHDVVDISYIPLLKSCYHVVLVPDIVNDPYQSRKTVQETRLTLSSANDIEHQIDKPRRSNKHSLRVADLAR